jgi:U3 small nucleolar RNA-associated protein 6
MAGASDKARFYLEQSVPELKEYERKQIFSSVGLPLHRDHSRADRYQDEIASIARKRSNFEHKLNARGSQPSDYARYAEFEINVDSLRKKRVKRLKIKSVNHTGQRRIFFILDRATRKFPGDVGLWMQQIELARRQKAYKKLSQILTRALRLHPTKPELWTYAAQFAVDEHADMTEARSYMQRGLRFCKSSKSLWLEYAKLELLYVAKINARREMLGLEGSIKPHRRNGSFNDADADVIDLPRLVAEDAGPTPNSTDDVDEEALQKIDKTPALSGAIPIAIFDAAMVQFSNDELVAQEFFGTVQTLCSLPCMRSILAHIVDHMLRRRPSSWRTIACNVKFACAGVDIQSPEFPNAFRISLKRLQGIPPEMRNSEALGEDIRAWLQTYLVNDSLDGALRQIMLSMLRQFRSGAGPPQPRLAPNVDADTVFVGT